MKQKTSEKVPPRSTLIRIPPGVLMLSRGRGEGTGTEGQVSVSKSVRFVDRAQSRAGKKGFSDESIVPLLLTEDTVGKRRAARSSGGSWGRRSPEAAKKTATWLPSLTAAHALARSGRFEHEDDPPSESSLLLPISARLDAA